MTSWADAWNDEPDDERTVFDVWFDCDPEPAQPDADDPACICLNCERDRTVSEHREAAPDSSDPDVFEITFKNSD